MAKNSKVEAAFHEVYSKVPKNVKKTGKTGEAKQKMMTAISLSKARAAGADIPEADHNPGNPGRQRPFAVSQSYDVYNGHAGDAASGVTDTQSEGRSGLPSAEAVKDAQPEAAGYAKKCVDQQVGENRLYLNKHDQEHNTGKAHE